MMTDLFSNAGMAAPAGMHAHVKPNYDRQTSAAAHADVKPKTNDMERRVLAALRGMGGQGTPDEVARYTSLDILTVRPRFTALKDKGMIAKTAERRIGDRGKSTKVWKVIA